MKYMKYKNVSNNNIYILLYQINEDSYIWVVKISYIYDDLYNIIRKINNNTNEIGNYYIIKRRIYEPILDTEYKQFELYNIQKHDELSYTTE